MKIYFTAYGQLYWTNEIIIISLATTLSQTALSDYCKITEPKLKRLYQDQISICHKFVKMSVCPVERLQSMKSAVGSLVAEQLVKTQTIEMPQLILPSDIPGPIEYETIRLTDHLGIPIFIRMKSIAKKLLWKRNNQLEILHPQYAFTLHHGSPCYRHLTEILRHGVSPAHSPFVYKRIKTFLKDFLCSDHKHKAKIAYILESLPFRGIDFKPKELEKFFYSLFYELAEKRAEIDPLDTFALLLPLAVQPTDPWFSQNIPDEYRGTDVFHY